VFWPTFFSTVLDAGIADALTLNTARDPSRLRPSLRSGMFIATAVSLAGAALGWALLPIVLKSDQAALLRASRWALILIPANLFSLIPIGALQGLHRFRAVAAVRTLSVLSYLASVAAVLIADRASVNAFLWLTVLSRILPLPIGLAFLLPAWLRAPSGALRTQQQATDGAKMHVGRLATVVTAAEDRGIASWSVSQASIGQWHVASTLTFLMPFIAQGVSQQLFARAARAARAERAVLIRVAYIRSILTTALLTILAAPLLPFVMPLVFGREFASAVAPAIIVTCGAVISAGIVALQAGARAAMHNRMCVESEIAGGIALAAAAWPLIHWAHLPGLAVAFVIGRLACLAVLVGRGRTTVGWVASDLLPISGPFWRHTAEQCRALRRALVGDGRNS
jgi:O-antigen/teichoic acid export membrane protein